jgi:monofunctional biosynthetic peptidoglycan transglycosylase
MHDRPAAAAAIGAGRTMVGGLFRWIARLFVLLIALSVVLVALYRFVPPPGTPLMVIRWIADGAGIDQKWVPLDRMSLDIQRAVIASEDARFCEHFGFDWLEIERAINEAEQGEKLRGASTITQQTAKNLFLWPGRNLVRKGLEAWFTLLMETLWPKSRILEVYLNVVEWEDGTYGVEAAARRHFRTSASRLTAQQSALLAAVLPNPRVYSTNNPTSFIGGRAATIRARMDQAQVTRKGVCR